ncbi:unnamed protein product [Cylicocyclus nassatus]|uniref:Uncharacterized protein n=1 Tax=Cylicocyclus nassatus TaxID=53992 RepID=A0AA36DV38_CYLNA|nr:unnamed protein product [Cylicocyclus nassatus]
MLETLKETIVNVQNEISSGVERLRFNVAPSLAAQQKCVSDAVDEIVKTSAGSDMLLKFQLSLDQMRVVADEGVQLANLCSTRMGRAQQMCRERADAVMAIDSFLRNASDLEKKMKDMNRQVDKLVRFCNQTEQAMTHLEALNNIVRTEEEVDLIRQQTRSATTILNIDPSPSPALVLNTAVRPGDEARERQEEVMLEEFLSGKRPSSPV